MKKYNDLIESLQVLVESLDNKAEIAYSSCTEKGYTKSETYTEIMEEIIGIVNEFEE